MLAISSSVQVISKCIAFARVCDPLTHEYEYQFAGVFELDGKCERDGRPYRRYRRILDSIPLAEGCCAAEIAPEDLLK